MSKRTTIDISDLLALVNRRNKKGTQTPEARNAVNELLSDILLETGNYEGFGYLEARDVPEGETPGITKENGKQELSDHSRRHYYTSDRLRKQARKRPVEQGSLAGIFRTMNLIDSRAE